MNISTRSQFRQVADILRQRIEAGTYSAGSVLPKEDDLAGELSVTRGTVNNALKILEAEGLVRAIRGKGTIVRELPPIMRNAQNRYAKATRERGHGAFDVEVRALGREPRIELEVARVVPPQSVAAALGVPADQASVVSRARRMSADTTPLQIAVSYIPLSIAEGTALETQDTGPGGMISRYTDLGHQQVRITEQLSVRPPTQDEASFLAMTEDQRVYEVIHTGWDASGQAVEVTIHVMPTHQWTLNYGWDLT